MNLNDVHHGIHKNKSRKRIGRGPGSGQGKTAGRGSKGQGSRSGSSTSPIFEGGQMPLVRRIPKRGFTNRCAETVAIVNLALLEKHFQSGEEVSPETIRGKGLVKGKLRRVESARRRRADQESQDLRPPASAARRPRRSRRPAGKPSSCPARSPW